MSHLSCQSSHYRRNHTSFSSQYKDHLNTWSTLVKLVWERALGDLMLKKKKVSQERFNKFICRKNLDFKKNILSAPSSSFWVHIFGTIDRWLLKVFIDRVSQGKKQVLNLTESPTFDESFQARFIRRTTRHKGKHLANKLSCSTINRNGWSDTCPRKFTLLLQKLDKKSVKI